MRVHPKPGLIQNTGDPHIHAPPITRPQPIEGQRVNPGEQIRHSRFELVPEPGAPKAHQQLARNVVRVPAPPSRAVMEVGEHIRVDPDIVLNHDQITRTRPFGFHQILVSTRQVGVQFNPNPTRRETVQQVNRAHIKVRVRHDNPCGVPVLVHPLAVEHRHAPIQSD